MRAGMRAGAVGADVDPPLVAGFLHFLHQLQQRTRWRATLAGRAKVLGDRLAMVEALEEERLCAARVQAVLEAAVTVSHEVNNPLTVLQLRLGRLMSSLSPGTEATEHLEVAMEAARQISQVTMRLRNVVRLVSTHYLSGDTPMIDLRASLEHDAFGPEQEVARSIPA